MISVPGIAPGFTRRAHLLVPSEESPSCVARASAYLPPRERAGRARKAAYPGLLGLGSPGMLGATGAALAPWTPADIPSLTLLLDAASGIVTTADSGDAGSDLDLTSWTSSVGGHVFAFSSVRPNFRANDANLNGQPSALFDITNNRLTCSTSITIAWLAVVAWYPAALFSGLDTIMTRGAGSGLSLLRGETGGTSANWRTSGETAGTRYRNGAATNVALTTANAAHLYEMTPSSPITTSDWVIGSDPASFTRIWRGGMGLILAASAVPSAPDRASLLAYCQTRFLTP